MTSLAEAAPVLSTPHLTHPKYRPDIDGLRAIAVMSVVLFHAFPRWLPGGFIGVDIFFIISGYLISTIIYGSLERNAFSFPEFYARRIKRIFPALLLVLISCYAFGWFTLFADEFQQLGKHIAGGSGFISNFVLHDESGYFDTTAEIKPLLHLWSLGIEEQFYIVWPLILWAAWKMRLNVLTLTVLCLGVSFLLNMANIGTDPSGTFYLPQTRAWELLAGSVLAYMTTHHGARTRTVVERAVNAVFMREGAQISSTAMRSAQSALGLALLAIGFAIVTSAGFPGWQATIPCAGAILIISAGPQAWLNRNLLANKLFVWIGLISFPLYLWHWPLLTFARIIEGEMPAREIRIAAVVSSIVLAWLTYKLVELPLRRREWPFKTAALVLIMACTGAAGYLTYDRAGLPERPHVVKAQAISDQYAGSVWKFATNHTCIYRYRWQEAGTYPWWFCMANKDEDPTVILLGNSYANHLYPGLIEQADISGQSILSIGACDVYLAYSTQPAEPATPCASDRPRHQLDYIKSVIQDTGTVKYVIWSGFEPVMSADYVAKAEETLNYLEAKGIQVIVFPPHFRKPVNIKSCFSRPLKEASGQCTFDAAERKKIDAGFAPLRDAIIARHPKTKIFDPNDIFCNDVTCSIVQDGLPMYRDEFQHLSPYASKLLAEKFAEWSKVNLPEILK